MKPTPSLSYIGFVLEGQSVAYALLDEKKRLLESGKKRIGKEGNRFFSEKVVECAKRHQAKIVGAGLIGGSQEEQEAIGSLLWLKHDVVPYFASSAAQDKQLEKWAERVAAAMIDECWDGRIAKVVLGTDRSVIPAFLTRLEDYRSVSSRSGFAMLLGWAKRYKGAGIRTVFFSSTPNGGGVALMRHALIRLYRLLGVQVSWHVLLPDAAAFAVTKNKFHNVLQAVAGQEVVLTARDKKVYNDWIAKNAKVFQKVYKNADVVVIDDPQPSGLIPYIKKENPQAKIIYRSHIQIRADLIGRKGRPQEVTWSFLKKNIYQADLFVSHPIEAFVPRDLPKKKVVFMPATTDMLDGLNKELSAEQLRAYERVFNALLAERGQKPLVFSRPSLIQVARFDPSKGIPDVVEAYRRFRKKFDDLGKPLSDTPQLIIVGNGAVDDPQGKLILQEVQFLLEMDRYRHLADDIKVAQVPHIDQLLNTLLRRSAVALQLSHREGFEVKVTEALHKGLPVIAYRTGGIPLQVDHRENGFLVTTGNTKKVGQDMYELFTDKRAYRRLAKNAARTFHEEYWTVANAARWLFLAVTIAQGTITGQRRWVEEWMQDERTRRIKNKHTGRV